MWRICILLFWLVLLLQPDSTIQKEMTSVLQVVLSVKEQSECCWVAGEEMKAAVLEI